VNRLERYFDRITSCRVTLSAPRRKQRGGIFRLRIDLAVPGEEILIDHEAGLDPAHADVHLALRDAFKAARRRLQDHVRRGREFTAVSSASALRSEKVSPAAREKPARVVTRGHGVWETEIQVGPVRLPATFTIPAHVQALVIFAEPAPSARSRDGSRRIADILHSEHVGTLRVELLTVAEQKKKQNAFDIPLLTRRLATVTRWAQEQEGARELPIGYFGADNGSAAALDAAAEDPAIGAVVSRGGHPGLAAGSLPFVHVPTLLIVGGEDGVVLTENRKAFAKLGGPKDIVVIPGASHVFAEPGALEEVARKARAWFIRYLTPTSVVG
jgi:pimeloyl-ACP methyl ester carboxylesterase